MTNCEFPAAKFVNATKFVAKMAEHKIAAEITMQNASLGAHVGGSCFSSDFTIRLCWHRAAYIPTARPAKITATPDAAIVPT